VFGFRAPAFKNRHDAGVRLAERLKEFANRPGIVVVALPRGGVPVGREVAIALGAELRALVVRKLGAPGNPELAIGAIASDGSRYLDEGLIDELAVSDDYVATEIGRQEEEVRRRLAAYGSELPPLSIEDRSVIVVDDGVATGSTIEAALKALRLKQPRELVVAVPVGSVDVLNRLAGVSDRVIAVERPEMVFGVGAWYEDFSQTTDEEVRELLAHFGPSEGSSARSSA
jgi:putative phosphoribosyl transferase